MESSVFFLILNEQFLSSLVSLIFRMKSIECLILVHSDFCLFLSNLNTSFLLRVMLCSWSEDPQCSLFSPGCWALAMAILSTLGLRDTGHRLGRLLEIESFVLIAFLGEFNKPPLHWEEAGLFTFSLKF